MRTTFRLLQLSALLVVASCGSTNDSTSASTPPPAGQSAAEPAPASQEESPAKAAAAPKAVIKGDAVAGKTVYESNCSACHQKDGAGMGGALGADFVNDPTRKAKSDAELFASIRDGVPNTTMIAWGALLKDQERADALAYIRTTFMN